MSLFSDYPGAPARPHGDRCCNAVVARPGQPLRLWQVVHELGHSRVPFSVAFLASVVDCDLGLAAEVISDAIDEEWVEEVMPEVPDDRAVLYVGQLARKR